MGSHIGYVVVLEQPINDEYSTEQVMTALKQIKGVVDVRPVANDIEAVIADRRVRSELVGRLIKLIEEFRK